MKTGSINISYKIFLISTSLFVLSFVANVFKFLFNDVTYHILYRVVPVSVLMAGFISLFGLYFAFRGSKDDTVNVKKKNMALYGNLIYVVFVLAVMVYVYFQIRSRI